MYGRFIFMTSSKILFISSSFLHVYSFITYAFCWFWSPSIIHTLLLTRSFKIIFFKLKIDFFFGVDDSDWVDVVLTTKMRAQLNQSCMQREREKEEKNKIFGGTLWLCACMHKNAVACCQHFSRNKTNLKFIARQHSPCIYIVYLCI